MADNVMFELKPKAKPSALDKLVEAVASSIAFGLKGAITLLLLQYGLNIQLGTFFTQVTVGHVILMNGNYALIFAGMVFLLWVIIRICIALFNLFTLMFRRRKVVQPAPDFFTPEKMQPGSAFYAHEAPGFQADVYGIRGRDWYKSGQGFVIGTRFYTAFHVIDSFEKIGLETRNGCVQLSREHFKLIEGDIAYVNLKSDTMCDLGLTSKARFSDGAKMTDSGLFASIHSFGQASLGFLEPHSSFGFVKYTGSTTGGFSGAPYYVGRTVYGMHVGGNSCNLGYDSAYLSMLAKKGLEDSEDYLFGQIKNRREFSYSRSPYDPDEFRVKVNNRYFVVDNDTLGDLMKLAEAKEETRQAVYDDETLSPEVPDQKSHSEVDRQSTRSKPLIQEVDKMSECSFDDNESKNEQRPQHVNAGEIRRLVEQEVARKWKPTLRKKPASPTQATRSTPGHKLIRARRNEVSNDISAFLKKLSLAQHNLRGQSVENFSKDSEGDSVTGELIQLRDALKAVTLRTLSAQSLETSI